MEGVCFCVDRWSKNSENLLHLPKRFKKLQSVGTMFIPVVAGRKNLVS